MTTEFINNYLDKKIEENEEYIVCTFYDLRVNHNVAESDVDKFLELAKIKLEHMNYQVYFTGAEFTYKFARRTVQDNEYMIAIKNAGEVEVK